MSINYELKIFTNKLPIASKSIRRLASKIVSKTAHDIEGSAKTKAPVDTGFLKSSIHVVLVDEFNSIVAVDAEYALHVELGTRFQRAQPYLLPAVTENRRSFELAMAEILDTNDWDI